MIEPQLELLNKIYCKVVELETAFQRYQDQENQS